MDRYIITGFSGFVSRHFLLYLEKNKIDSIVLGVDITEPLLADLIFEHVKWSFIKINLLHKNKLKKVINDFNPNYIIHLASYSSVAYSWKEPVLSFQNNTNIFLSLLDTIRLANINCRILSVGSSEEYGNVNIDDLPLKEESYLNPTSPYAVARVSQELLSKIYVDGYDLDIVNTRSFNHIGPYQQDIFVISSFAKQLVKIKRKELKNGKLLTGDISIIRDFLDVRDVVEAYYLLCKKGGKGEIYNICSGKGYTLKEIINKMTEILNINIIVVQSKNLMRPINNRAIIGSNKKIRKQLNWNIKYTLKDSLCDIIEYWETEVKSLTNQEK